MLKIIQPAKIARWMQNEEKTACEAGDGVAQAFRWGAANEEILFVFRDEVDVFFDVALGHVGSSFEGLWIGFGSSFEVRSSVHLRQIVAY